ncbi:Cytosol aminopeptidase [bioreactor metagenome]|uniref:Cytosol aminopeptidase n=1 Tax=bioreactor metagenome TaxID=1076179 RepID=A0A645FCE2_9ZZZZ
MGGLLGVNRGSVEEPTFTIMEYKPKKHVNKKPYVFVGKGIMYDTGGLNLKPGASMADMKCDMSGGAAVAGALYLIAAMQLPVHVVGLVPATDNRPGGNAYAPGDVLTMMNGKTVEVLNTDAEGRLILADALAYAQKYDPAVVVDIATLTGAAHAAIGHYAIVGMEANATGFFERIHSAAEEVFERIVEFPFWDEYAEQLKSSVADMANIGSRYAGAITAGKFLEKFTDYPYIHLDIAGPAFMESAWNYWPQGGTGVGVRLFYQFIKDEADRK